MKNQVTTIEQTQRLLALGVPAKKASMLWMKRSETWVDPATVGQFTGLLDKKQREIYEGDIINWLSIKPGGVGYVEQGHIEWRQIEGCYVVVNRFDTTDHRELIYQLIRCTRDITVIGNIHDNPELLKTE